MSIAFLLFLFMTLDFNINGKPKNQRKPTKKKSFQVRDNAFLIYSNSLQEVNTKRLKKKKPKKIHTAVCTIHYIT